MEGRAGQWPWHLGLGCPSAVDAAVSPAWIRDHDSRVHHVHHLEEKV